MEKIVGKYTEEHANGISRFMDNKKPIRVGNYNGKPSIFIGFDEIKLDNIESNDDDFYDLYVDSLDYCTELVSVMMEYMYERQDLDLYKSIRLLKYEDVPEEAKSQSEIFFIVENKDEIDFVVYSDPFVLEVSNSAKRLLRV